MGTEAPYIACSFAVEVNLKGLGKPNQLGF